MLQKLSLVSFVLDACILCSILKNIGGTAVTIRVSNGLLSSVSTTSAYPGLNNVMVMYKNNIMNKKNGKTSLIAACTLKNINICLQQLFKMYTSTCLILNDKYET